MKLALLLPGFLDSPDYTHMTTFDTRLTRLGYTVVRIDPCNLWSTNNMSAYTVTNYINQVITCIASFKMNAPSEVVLIGHSLGALVSIVVGNWITDITKVVSLCCPGDISNLAEKWQGKKMIHSERDLPNNPSQKRSFEVPYDFVTDGLQYSAIQEVKTLHKPLMVFIAENDAPSNIDNNEKMVAEARSPYVVRQPHMGHNFRLSPQECDIVADHIENFLTTS